jgi:Ribbon-helix-helix domain
MPIAARIRIDNIRMGIYCNEWQVTRRQPRAPPMSRKKISTTVYITPEQNERLHLLHERTKVPVAVYIREGIDLVLKRYEHELPGQMTLTDAVPRATARK